MESLQSCAKPSKYTYAFSQKNQHVKGHFVANTKWQQVCRHFSHWFYWIKNCCIYLWNFQKNQHIKCHFVANTKWQQFCRRHFILIFLNQNCCLLTQISLKLDFADSFRKKAIGVLKAYVHYLNQWWLKLRTERICGTRLNWGCIHIIWPNTSSLSFDFVTQKWRITTWIVINYQNRLTSRHLLR